MKIFLSLFLASAFFFAGCKKNNTAYIATDPNALDGASVISTGKIAFWMKGMMKAWQKFTSGKTMSTYWRLSK